MSAEPTGAKEWSQIAKTLPEGSTKIFNRFVARYRLASLFDGMKVDGLSAETVRGYEAMFSVFMSYTALELLIEGIADYWDDKSIKNECYDFNLISAELEQKLRMNSKLRQFLLDEIESTLLKIRINNFFENKASNLTPILAGIRHKVAHGDLSVAGINADTKVNSDAIWDASKLLLEATDDLFYSFIRSIE